MSDQAPSYEWACGACESSNSAGISLCQSCGCPALANRALLDEWRLHGRVRPRKPSIAPDPLISLITNPLLGRVHTLTEPVAYCARCALMMYLQDEDCPHCGYVHSPPEKKYQRQHAADYTGRGVRHGIRYWFFFFVFVFGALYLYLNI